MVTIKHFIPKMVLSEVIFIMTLCIFSKLKRHTQKYYDKRCFKYCNHITFNIIQKTHIQNKNNKDMLSILIVFFVI